MKYCNSSPKIKYWHSKPRVNAQTYILVWFTLHSPIYTHPLELLYKYFAFFRFAEGILHYYQSSKRCWRTLQEKGVVVVAVFLLIIVVILEDFHSSLIALKKSIPRYNKIMREKHGIVKKTLLKERTTTTCKRNGSILFMPFIHPFIFISISINVWKYNI